MEKFWPTWEWLPLSLPKDKQFLTVVPTKHRFNLNIVVCRSNIYDRNICGSQWRELELQSRMDLSSGIGSISY